MWALLISALAAVDGGAPAFELTWIAPPVCGPKPDTEVLLPGVRGSADVVISPRRPEGWTLDVQLNAPVVGRRRVETNTCAEAVQAAELLLEMGAKGRLAPEVSAGVEQPSATTDGAVAKLPETPLVPVFSLVTAAQLVTMPRLQMSVGLEAWLIRGPASVSLAATTAIPTPLSGGPTADAGLIWHSVITGDLNTCWGFTFTRVRVVGCANLRASLWRLQGANVENAKTGYAAWIAAGPAVRTLITLTQHLLLQVGVSVPFSIVKPSAVLEGYGVVAQANLVGVVISAGIGFTP